MSTSMFVFCVVSAGVPEHSPKDVEDILRQVSVSDDEEEAGTSRYTHTLYDCVCV